MTTAQHYDAIVIGSGQAGGPLSTALAGSGLKTAIIEREHVGGTCINEGCTPTKTMVASARNAYLVRRAADYGVNVGPLSVDMTVVRKRKRDIVDSFRGGSQGRLEKAENLDLIFGEASFTGPKSITVKPLHGGEDQQLTAHRIFINVGARPAGSKVEGIDTVAPLNSTSIMELDSVPEHLIVLGGGYIGLEFGQMFRRFGSKVTVVQRGKRLLAREDADVADEVAKILREDGIDVLLQTEATRARKLGDGSLELTRRGPDGERTITGSHVLEAAGRTSNADSLNLQAAGVAVDDHDYIKVNEKLETNVDGIYALGDVKGGPAFTHISYDDFRIVRTNLIERGSATTTDRAVTYTVYIDPQLGRIGLSEDAAREAGRNFHVAKMPMTSVARALEVDETRGFMKVLVDDDTDLLLGAAILGIEGGEIMSMVQLAMMGNLTSKQLRDTTFAHPTLAEALNNLFS